MNTQQDWLIETIMRQGKVVGIESSPADVAASAQIMVDQACSIAAGTPWQKKQTTQGNVVYVTARDPGVTKMQIRTWCAAHQIDQAELDQHLRVWEGPLELRDSLVVASFTHAIEDGDQGMLGGMADADGGGMTFMLGIGSSLIGGKTYPKMPQVTAIFIDDLPHCVTYGANDPMEGIRFLRNHFGATIVVLARKQQHPKHQGKKKRPKR
jgi:hypothetical protein